MTVSLLVEVDEQEELDEGEDFPRVLLPVGLLEEHVDHDHDELVDVYGPFVQVEPFLDLR